MKLSSIFMIANGVAADYAAGDAALNEVIGQTGNMFNAPAFVDALDGTVRQKWLDRIDKVVKRHFSQVFDRCGDYDNA